MDTNEVINRHFYLYQPPEMSISGFLICTHCECMVGKPLDHLKIIHPEHYMKENF